MSVATRPAPSGEPLARRGRSGGAARARYSSVGLPALGIVAALVVWWGAVALFQIRPIFLPSPLAVAQVFGEQGDYLAHTAWDTLYRLLIGFAIAAAFGLSVALLLSWSRPLERAVMPLFLALNAVPKVSLAPLLMVWLGFGPRFNIVMVVSISTLPVLVSTMAGLAATPSDLGELARSLTASWWQAYLKVRLPWALPHMFVGLKLAITLAVIGEAVAELQNPNSGLGSVVTLAGASFDTALAFAAIVVLSLLGVLLFYAVTLVERLLLPWARQIAG
ncbi:ABC transporter permease [Rhizomonospora bruguierae]|uniref:ABC transporter permease n=1 Tax=Rhizomonospora bruguierae TaxID=1581705 RepID=UPI001BCE5478|nr:ABC transporter permease [Micromonospora sp. NBRC 107566]